MGKSPEKSILEAARRVFTEYGFEGARMQYIADEAGVNKAMLHYYFRSKKKLFEKVYRGAVARMMPQLMQLLNADLSLEDKISKLVERYISLMREHPRLPGFIIQELHQNREVWFNFIEGLEVGAPEAFLQQIQEKRQKGEIMDIAPRQLLVNILSLCVFPFAARPMIQYMLEMDDETFEQFLEVRKNELTTFILNAVKP